ncbi:MAG: Zn-dependent hydrolase [Gammaproteobacteria bacterium]|nr:Zn-dependent hydrolase [Gammaproteobacteria bacterium]
MEDRIDGDRLWRRLMAMAEIGATSRGGSNRQALSDEDAAGRALFLGWVEAAGCTWETDEIGNLFVRRPGRDNSLPSVLIGSHLDTQPTGGRFDGVYGVLGGLEVIETLNDREIRTDAPIDLVVWTNEEGSRFRYSMMGSAVWAGKLGINTARDLVDGNGVSVGEELDRLGWAGKPADNNRSYAGAFELHIEQGPILEAENLEIGVVTGVQGFRWYTICLKGNPVHAGPTPMGARNDPARGIGEIVTQVYAMVAEYAPSSRATFAQFASIPASPNTVPEELKCSLDLRHPDRSTLDAMDKRLRQIVSSVSETVGVESEIILDNNSPPVVFNRKCVEAVQDVVTQLGLSNRQMVSGAGHDACYVALKHPTSMIFVPCDRGISHNEAENISPKQAECGASVLLGAVLRIAKTASI